MSSRFRSRLTRLNQSRRRRLDAGRHFTGRGQGIQGSHNQEIYSTQIRQGTIHAISVRSPNNTPVQRLFARLLIFAFRGQANCFFYLCTPGNRSSCSPLSDITSFCLFLCFFYKRSLASFQGESPWTDQEGLPQVASPRPSCVATPNQLIALPHCGSVV